MAVRKHEGFASLYRLKDRNYACRYCHRKNWFLHRSGLFLLQSTFTGAWRKQTAHEVHGSFARLKGGGCRS